MFCLHKWGRWSEPYIKATKEVSEWGTPLGETRIYYQERFCKKCHKRTIRKAK